MNSLRIFTRSGVTFAAILSLAELVLGNGLLVWHVGDSEVRHPFLVIARVHLDFDSDAPAFRVLDTGYPPELYHAIFRKMVAVPGSVQNEIRQSFEREPLHPMGESTTVLGWCKRVAQWLNSNGDALDRIPTETLAVPRIAETPWLFVRSRTYGFSGALDAILSDLDSREDLPSALTEIVGAGSREQRTGDGEGSQARTEELEALFCLPANEEQAEIARSLANSAGIVVQGPPGHRENTLPSQT